MRFKQILMIASAWAAASALAGCETPLAIVYRAPITIATSNPGATYHPVGNAICRIVNRSVDEEPAMRCKAIESDGAVANMGKVRNRQASLGLTQSDLAYGAFRGEGPFSTIGPNPDLRIIAALHREAFTIIARAESAIRDFEDLRGRRVGIGKSGAGYTYTRDVVLKFYGWKISEFDRALELGPMEQNRTLCEDRVDVIILQTAHPDGLTQEAMSDCAARLVRIAGPSIDRLLATHPYYAATIIPGGLYPGQRDDVPTIGTQTFLIASRHLSNAFAYTVAKALLEGFEDFRRLHPALRLLRKGDMVPSESVIPMHPGALRYYREAGLVP
jgi:TRAP transporter TAXI family solute receptor